MIEQKNEQLKQLISELKKLSIEQKTGFWKRIAEELEKPSRNQRIVNLARIDKYTKENETVIVPGKVLAGGEINHKINVAAYSFSQEAFSKIINKKGNATTISEFMKKNPKPKDVKIMG